MTTDPLRPNCKKKKTYMANIHGLDVEQVHNRPILRHFILFGPRKASFKKGPNQVSSATENLFITIECPTMNTPQWGIQSHLLP